MALTQVARVPVELNHSLIAMFQWTLISCSLVLFEKTYYCLRRNLKSRPNSAEEIWLRPFDSKTPSNVFVYITSEEFKNATITFHFGFVFQENSGRELNHMIIVTSSFWKVPFFPRGNNCHEVKKHRHYKQEIQSLKKGPDKIRLPWEHRESSLTNHIQSKLYWDIF